MQSDRSWYQSPYHVLELSNWYQCCYHLSAHWLYTISLSIDGGTVELDEMGWFLHHLGETALSRALERIEKVMPAAPRVYTAATKGAAGGASGKRVLSRLGRACVVKMKDVLPSLSPAELKKVVKKAGMTPRGADKETLAHQLIEYFLPGYPIEHPNGSESEGEDDDGA